MRLLGLAVCAALGANAHGDHGAASQKPMVPDDADWMTKHMAEEHHMTGFDATSFFALHDFNSDGFWQGDEMLRTYGLFDESNKDVSPERRVRILMDLLSLLDADEDGMVSREEFVLYMSLGKTLPDMETGPGHHGDDEYEYEIHHFEKYHTDDSPDEEFNHPEDIEHFRKHEELEEEEERLEAMDRQAIIEENIPEMFLRSK